MYSSSQPRLLHWYLYMAPLWLSIGSLSLGGDQKGDHQGSIGKGQHPQGKDSYGS